MIKKIIFLVCIAAALFLFYKKFVAPVVEPGIKESGGTVDFFGKKHEMSDDTEPSKTR